MRLTRLTLGLMATLALALSFASGPEAASAISVQRDGAVEIAGRSMRCGDVRSKLDPRLENLGISIPDRSLIVINPALLRRESDTVRLFVYSHECGHHNVGASELGADCWAVRRGLREGWLDKDGLRQVCGSFGNAPETPTHPSASRRCSNLNRCFATEVAALAREKATAKPQQPPATPAEPAAAAAYEASPKLVSEPKLVRSGRTPQ